MDDACRDLLLLVDAGNHRIKWGLYADALGGPGEDAAWIARGSVTHDTIEGLAETWMGHAGPPRARTGLLRAHLACVAGGIVREALGDALSRCAIPWTEASSAASLAGVDNGYRNPAQLGVDRWMALLAAWRRVAGACIVVNSGTAITVDALDGQGRFLGGGIAPGLGLMRASLIEATHLGDVAPGEYAAFPDHTADALCSGTLDAALGLIGRMRDRLRGRTGALPVCLLAGGDAARLARHMDGPVRIAEHLVLEGLAIHALAVSRPA